MKLLVFALAIACVYATAETTLANGDATVNCTVIEAELLECAGIEYAPFVEEHAKFPSLKFWLYAGASLVLVLFAGLMSGLTIGLMAIPMMDLEILKNSGSEKERRYAAKLIPILKKHHLVLVTLLLSNAAAMEALPLALDRISSPVVAIIVSVTLVLFFGEIIPQALVLKFGLAIGANLAPVLKGLMILLFPISWPISKVLDRVFGEEDMEFYGRVELKQLVDLHQTHGNTISETEAAIIKGALDLTNKTARDCMTPIANVNSIDINAIYDDATREIIAKAGHSRIPVFDTQRTHLVGLLLVKNLLQVRSNTPVKDLITTLPSAEASMGLYDLLALCKGGTSHLIALHEALPTEIIGIVTLEDVIEELLGQEILDETDVRRVEQAQLFLRRVSEYVSDRTSSTERRGMGSSRSSRKSSRKGPRQTAHLLSDDE